MGYLVDAFRKAILESDETPTAIARRAGVNFYTVQRIAKGKTPNPGYETLRKIANALENAQPVA